MSDARAILARLMAREGLAPSVPVEAATAPMGALEEPRTLERVRTLREAQASAPATLKGNDLFAAFVELARNDPTYLERLAHAFEWKAPFAKAKPVKACPLLKANSIEITLGDNGPPKPSKAKDGRERPEREPFRFSGTIKINTGSNLVLSAPDWTGRIEFRSGVRAKHDAKRFNKEGTFTADFRDMIDQAVNDFATTDMMFGFLRADTEGDGSPSVSGFLFVASKEALIKRDPAMIVFALDPKGTSKAKLPPFDTKTNKGNRLGHGFHLQCRASVTARDWATGLFKFERF